MIPDGKWKDYLPFLVFGTAAVLFLTGLGLLLVSVPGDIQVKEIQVRGESFLAEDEVRKLAGLRVGELLSGEKQERVLEKLRAHPAIRSVRLFEESEGALVVQLEERVCLAVVRLEPAGELYDLSEDLRILSRGAPRCSGVPMITGRFNKTPDEFTDARLKRLAESWKVLRKTYPALARRISEIRVRGERGFTIYFTGTSFRVEGAGVMTEDFIHRLYAGIAYLEGKDYKSGKIDLRGKDALFTP